MSLDSFDDLAMRAEYPPPAFHVAILRSQHKLLRERPDGVSHIAIGADAWRSLDDEQRDDALALMLNLYVSTVNTEENDRRLEQDAADPGKTYLDAADVGTLWDSIHCAEVDPVEADRWALIRVLSELELLQHRLAMRDQPT